MGLGNLGLWEMVMIGLLVLVVFGPRRLPEIARSMGNALREFRRGVNEIQRELEEAERGARLRDPPAPRSTPREERAHGPGGGAGPRRAGEERADRERPVSPDGLEGEGLEGGSEGSLEGPPERPASGQADLFGDEAATGSADGAATGSADEAATGSDR